MTMNNLSKYEMPAKIQNGRYLENGASDAKKSSISAHKVKMVLYTT